MDQWTGASRRRFIAGMAGLAATHALGRAWGAEGEWAWAEREGAALSLAKGGEALWTLNYPAGDGKPFFHPLRTVSGYETTWLRPADHVWHRALWFSWKLINGLNYWEEDPKTGLSEGRSELAAAKVERSAEAARARMEIRYRPPGKAVLLTEDRLLTMHRPEKDGSYRIDWEATFTAGQEKVVLDRTKPLKHGGVEWGGYAGLSWRGAQSMKNHAVLDSNGWTMAKRFFGYGEGAKWMDFSGTVDAAAERWAGVAIMDHPTSARHPSPWYVIIDGAFGYFSPAILFHEAMTINPGEALKLKYRIVVHEERGEAGWLNREYERFARA